MTQINYAINDACFDIFFLVILLYIALFNCLVGIGLEDHQSTIFLFRETEGEEGKECKISINYFVTYLFHIKRSRDIHKSQPNKLLTKKKMNRIAFNAVVRAARVNPAIRSAAPYRWVGFKFFLNIKYHLTLYYSFIFSNQVMLLVVNNPKDLLL